MNGNVRPETAITALLIAPDRVLAQLFLDTLPQSRSFQVLADLIWIPHHSRPAKSDSLLRHPKNDTRTLVLRVGHTSLHTKLLKPLSSISPHSGQKNSRRPQIWNDSG